MSKWSLKLQFKELQIMIWIISKKDNEHNNSQLKKLLNLMDNLYIIC